MAIHQTLLAFHGLDEHFSRLPMLPVDDISEDAAAVPESLEIREELERVLASPYFARAGVFALRRRGDPRSALWTPKGIHRALPQLGYVLTSSVRQEGDLLRISPRLVDETSGAQIWTGSFGDCPAGG